MGHWTPTGIEPTDYDDDDDVLLPQLGTVCSVARSPSSAPPPGIDSL